MSEIISFRNYLFRLRRTRGYSQKQLAALLGLRLRSTVSDLERGRRLPAIPVALTLEIVLGAKLSEIYPDLYQALGQDAVVREDRLPARFTRQIRGRVLGKDPDDAFHCGSRPGPLSSSDAPAGHGTQRRLPF